MLRGFDSTCSNAFAFRKHAEFAGRNSDSGTCEHAAFFPKDFVQRKYVFMKHEKAKSYPSGKSHVDIKKCLSCPFLTIDTYAGIEENYCAIDCGLISSAHK